MCQAKQKGGLATLLKFFPQSQYVHPAPYSFWISKQIVLIVMKLSPNHDARSNALMTSHHIAQTAKARNLILANSIIASTTFANWFLSAVSIHKFSPYFYVKLQNSRALPRHKYLNYCLDTYVEIKIGGGARAKTLLVPLTSEAAITAPIAP